jgi:hypothetical protein
MPAPKAFGAGIFFDFARGFHGSGSGRRGDLVMAASPWWTFGTDFGGVAEMNTRVARAPRI